MAKKDYSEVEMLCLFSALLRDGHAVILEDGTVLGNAADGVTVELGLVPSSPPRLNREGRQALYSYLNKHRTPDTW